MPPQALALALFIIEEGIKLEPAIAAEIQALLTDPDPTPEKWAALRAKIASKTYFAYVPASTLSIGLAGSASPNTVPEPVQVKVLPAPVVAPQADKPAEKPAPAAVAAPGIAVATDAAFSL